MSLQSKAKAEQGYVAPARMCANCRHFTSAKVRNAYGGIEEKNLRCAVGGFAITKRGGCLQWEPKP